MYHQHYTFLMFDVKNNNHTQMNHIKRIYLLCSVDKASSDVTLVAEFLFDNDRYLPAFINLVEVARTETTVLYTTTKEINLPLRTEAKICVTSRIRRYNFLLDPQPAETVSKYSELFPDHVEYHPPKYTHYWNNGEWTVEVHCSVPEDV